MNGRKVYALYHDNTTANDTLIAGTDQGIYISPDKGVSWILTNAPQNKCNSIELRRHFWYQRVLYACFENGLYYADNNLSEWKSMGLPGESITSYVELASDTVGVFACKSGLILFGENYAKKNKTSKHNIGEVVDMVSYWSGSYSDSTLAIL